MSSGKNNQSGSDQSVIRSYVTLRRAIGVLGMALPFIVSVGAYLLQRKGIQSSVSSYYYTAARNAFVGVLWAIGVFLAFYRGYECADSVASNLGGIFAIGISLFPTAPSGAATVDEQWIGRIHFAFAALFFITLAYMSLFLFTKTHPDKPKITFADYRSLVQGAKRPLDPERGLTRRKLQRNLVYIACGGAMLFCLAFIAVFAAFLNQAGTLLYGSNLVFWLEAIAIIAFGVSWLIKGEFVLGDKDKPEKAAPPSATPDIENA
jgi:hypothetical protein